MSQSMRDDSLLLPDDVLVAFGNNLLEQADSKLRIVGVASQGDSYVQFAAENPAGRSPEGRSPRLVAPICRLRNGVIGFRSILLVKDPAARRTTWLTNGQASRNTKEIMFMGEAGPKLAASRDAFVAWVRSSRTAETPRDAIDWQEGFIADELASGLYGDGFEIITGDERLPLARDEAVAPTP